MNFMLLLLHQKIKGNIQRIKVIVVTVINNITMVNSLPYFEAHLNWEKIIKPLKDFITVFIQNQQDTPAMERVLNGRNICKRYSDASFFVIINGFYYSRLVFLFNFFDLQNIITICSP